jgi:hypothetical protein
MPQATRSLSKSQILALESCYLFLKTLRPFLLSVANESLSELTRAQLDGTNELALLNQTRLLAEFPEVAEAAKRWGAR